MTTTKLTLSDYLAIADIYEGQQEFVDGEIIKMPPESTQNLLISLFLLTHLVEMIPLQQLRYQGRNRLLSTLFPQLELTVADLLQAGTG